MEKSNTSLLSAKMGNVDPEVGTAKPTKLRKKPPKDELNVGHISAERKRWLFFVWLMTAFIPDAAIKLFGGMRSASQVQAWREKMALCWFVLASSVSAILWLEGFSLLLCPQEKSLLGPTVVQLDIEELASEKDLVAVNGRLYDLRRSDGPVSNALRPYAGSDASTMFPLFAALGRVASATGGYADPAIAACVTNSSVADNWLAMRVRYDGSSLKIKNNTLTDCPTPGLTFEQRAAATTGKTCYYTIAAMKELQKMWIGYLRYYWTIIELGPGEDWKPHYVVVDKTVYDMTWYFRLALRRMQLAGDDPLVVLPRPQSMFLDEALSVALGMYGNRDATPVVDAFGTAMRTQTVACLDRLFFAGRIQSFKDRALCKIGNPILWTASSIVYLLTFVKFAASLHFFKKPKLSYMDKYCILFVPCYTEGIEGLKTTINSLALTDYADDRKLLCVVCDGNLTGKGNGKPTPRLALDVLGYKGEEPAPVAYDALGDGKDKINMAKVYGGNFTIQYHIVPYIVIAKVGKPSEEKGRPGNRGKRDSQLILMNFFNRLLKDDHLLFPLDYEIYYCIHKILGNDPRLYEFILMVDADTRIKANALDELVGTMLTKPDCIALCGETQVNNKGQSWVTAIQVHEYYISHHIGKAFESFFGKVTCLPGCFTMYRLKYPDDTPALVHDDIIADYSLNRVNTLHMKNLLHLGEDRYLTTLLLKYFPNKRLEFVFSAICWTDIPHTFAILLSQRRRWINSTFHNLVELLKLPNLCGAFLLSMKVVIISDLISTMILPAATMYMYWIIFKVIYLGMVFPSLAWLSILAVGLSAKRPRRGALNDLRFLAQASSNSSEYIFVLIGLAGMYGTHVVLFMAKGQYSYIWWLLVYLVLGLPVFSIILPVYAFWHFDEFGWGTTRRIQVDKDEQKGAAAASTTDPDAGVTLQRKTLKEFQRNDPRLHTAQKSYTKSAQSASPESSEAALSQSKRPVPGRLPASLSSNIIASYAISPVEMPSSRETAVPENVGREATTNLDELDALAETLDALAK